MEVREAYIEKAGDEQGILEQARTKPKGYVLHVIACPLCSKRNATFVRVLNTGDKGVDGVRDLGNGKKSIHRDPVFLDCPHCGGRLRINIPLATPGPGRYESTVQEAN